MKMHQTHVRQPGRGADIFGTELNLELLLLRKNSQRRCVCFGITEHWDPKRPFRSRAPHFPPAFMPLFCFVSVSHTALPSLRLACRHPFVNAWHRMTLPITRRDTCGSIATQVRSFWAQSKARVTQSQPTSGHVKVTTLWVGAEFVLTAVRVHLRYQAHSIVSTLCFLIPSTLPLTFQWRGSFSRKKHFCPLNTSLPHYHS